LDDDFENQEINSNSYTKHDDEKENDEEEVEKKRVIRNKLANDFSNPVKKSRIGIFKK